MRLELVITGRVQGVGFRPFLFHLARSLDLAGTIRNARRRVEVVLEGSSSRLFQFTAELKRRPPPMARIDHWSEKWSEAQALEELRILESASQAVDGALELPDGEIPPDLATCDECFREFNDPRNRRYGYPLLGCVNCGPRYSIIRETPYDRVRTSLAAFPPCASCRDEYHDPQDRRFHSQNISCQECGPVYRLYDGGGGELERGTDQRALAALAAAKLASGKILALKGVGGYQLVVDARNAPAIRRLRDLKRRPRQAFAVMAREMACLSGQVIVSEAARELLLSPARPVVILPADASCDLPCEWITPDSRTLGVMLPTTPMHLALFGLGDRRWADFLIVTSGNAHGEPICRDHHEAVERLGGIADFIVSHDRDILRACDDSVFIDQVIGPRPVRVARGLAPLRSARANAPEIIALGGDLKNTITVLAREQCVVSPHIGGLSEPRTYQAFQALIDRFLELYGVRAPRIAVDYHPQYLSSEYGRRLAAERDWPIVEVQHHHAHGAAAAAEHGLTEAIALVFDGTGFGTDQTIWGGELLHLQGPRFTRLGRLRPAPLPGGERAVLEPWRQGLARLKELTSDGIASLNKFEVFLRLGLLNSGQEKTAQALLNASVAPILTSSMGRLFDSMSALLGLAGGRITYEGEAAIRLEAAAGPWLNDVESQPRYPFSGAEVKGLYEIDPRATVAAAIGDRLRGLEVSLIAARFHVTVAEMAMQMIRYARDVTGCDKVVLSGGVFQNHLLLRLLTRLAEQAPFALCFHRELPCGDGGLSFGQAQVAWALKEGGENA